MDFYCDQFTIEVCEFTPGDVLLCRIIILHKLI